MVMGILHKKVFLSLTHRHWLWSCLAVKANQDHRFYFLTKGDKNYS